MIFRPLSLWVMPALLALVRGGIPNGDPLTEQETAKIGKILTWLIGIMSVELLVAAFVFKFLVAGEVTNLRLELARDYARRTDVVTKTEFDQTLREVNRRIDQPVTISREADTRLKIIESRLDRTEDRLLVIEELRAGRKR